MLQRLSIAIALSLVFLLACGGNYSKSCQDRVCTIVENGEVRYEGDPEKVKLLQERQQARIEADKNRELKYKNMPRRKQGEIIRVGVMIPETNDASFSKYRGTFYKWIVDTLSKDPQIQVVPHKKMKHFLSLVKTEIPANRGWNQDGPREKRVVIPNEETYKKLRDYGLEIDVLLYTSLSPKTQSGLVGGKGQGVGVVSASRIEVSGVASSIFDFKAHRHSIVGKSAGRIDIAGRDKKGEIKSASIKNSNRNIELDKLATESYARYYASVIKSQIAPHLPALEGLKTSKESTTEKTGEAEVREWLQKLLN